MKRTLLLVSATIFAAGAIMAQGIINNSTNLEGFESGVFPPPCWENLDEDGDGNAWFPYGFNPAMGDSSAASASWTGNAGPLTPDNYLILPQVTPMNGEHLSWYVAAQDPAYAADEYSVVVSTTGTAAADFDTELYNEVIADDVWVMRSVDLTAYEGMDIYLAFRHWNVTDMFYMKIDEVLFPTLTAPCTVGLEEFNGVSYNVDIFPNPSHGVVNFMSEEVIQSLDIRDVSGRLIQTLQVNNTNFVMDRNVLNSGVYFVTLNFEAGSMTEKLIIE